jgi:hypothetical protein
MRHLCHDFEGSYGTTELTGDIGDVFAFEVSQFNAGNARGESAN